MDLEQRISSFSTLGEVLRSFTELQDTKGLNPTEKNNIPSGFLEAMEEAETENPWFTRDNILQAFHYWGRMLDRPKLERWLENYRTELLEERKPMRVGVIMAGNIPLVGFHDLLCVLFSGNHLIAKLSSQDARLIPILVKSLEDIDSDWHDRIKLTTGEIEKPEAVIATGSNNASRYFSYYFGKYPNIIRKNRTGVAILDGNETPGDLQGIAADIFSYFGLGCRNISKLYLPEGYDLKLFHEALLHYKEIFHHPKYRNNLDYYKSIYLVNKSPFLDGVFYLLREEEVLSSPVSVIHYEHYDNLSLLQSKLNEQREQIQCVVTRKELLPGAVLPGETQQPALYDYADDVDTMAFLIEKI